MLAVVTAVVYYLSNPAPARVFDQTFTIADAMLSGHLGVPDPRSWLELAPGVDQHYSVFPLGAVLSMLPLATLAKLGLFRAYPAGLITACQAALLVLLVNGLASAYAASRRRRVLLILFLLYGNWTWCDLSFGAAWHHALGFSMIGQLAALFFILVRRSPALAGLSFALAFGNRTELVVVGPVLAYLLLLPEAGASPGFWHRAKDLLRFCAAPVLLLLLTFAYNYARFQSILDFGYTRIPYVQDEALFSFGLLSVKAIPANARVMLIAPWKLIDRFPYYCPTGFGESIFLCSPFLVYLFRRRSARRSVKLAAWLAVAVITFALWTHGNPGGYQYGYRYAMTLLPWFCLILLEGAPRAPGVFWRALEIDLLFVSIAINAYSVYAFYWGKYV